jgi:hypothetical protein
VSASLGTRAGVFPAVQAGGLAAAQGLAGNLALGFKADRLVGLLTLTFIDVTQGGTGGGSAASFALGPEFQVAIVRSEDRRVELLADAAISFGHLFSSSNGIGATSGVPSNIVIDYQIAIGGRYWFHRQFALQGLTGFGGEAFVDLDNGSENVSAHGVIASLGILTVF